jgi:hypothetical protein
MSQGQESGRPRVGRIPKAIEYSGISRSTLYELAPKWPGLFRKNGVSTLVDFDVLDSVLDGLPCAEIKPPGPRKPSAP